MEKLGIDPKLLLAQTVNFLIVLFVYARFVHKPFMKTLHDAKKKKQDLDTGLQKIQHEQDGIQRQKEQLDVELESRTKKMYAKIKSEAEEIRQTVLKQAQEEASQIREQNLQIIEKDREKMVQDVKKSGVTIASKLLEKAMSGISEGDLSKKVTANIIKKLPSINKV